MRDSADFSLSLSMLNNDLHSLRHYFFMRNCPAVNDILFCIQISLYGLFNISKTVSMNKWSDFFWRGCLFCLEFIATSYARRLLAQSVDDRGVARCAIGWRSSR